MKPYESFIHLSRYSRFIDEENRRETWVETVDRLVNFWKARVSDNIITDEEFQEVHTAILNREVMPSMRAMWSAGTALEQNHFRGYNCSFAAVNHIRVFDEILFILMAGTGVGFSAESQYVNKLPIINDTFKLSSGLPNFKISPSILVISRKPCLIFFSALNTIESEIL